MGVQYEGIQTGCPYEDLERAGLRRKVDTDEVRELGGVAKPGPF